MTTFQLIAALLTLAAAGGYINHRYMRLPPTIGSMTFALLVSLLAVLLDKMDWVNLDILRSFVGQVDFASVLLHGMLSFLLFAGALHINMSDLRNVRSTVGILATAGVVMATAINGTLVWLAAGLLGLHLPYIYALLFGALISPTDPIAIMAMLKQVGVSRNLYVKIGGESLFNDGVGVVVFVTLLSVALSPVPVSAGDAALMLLREAAGGLALGLLLGWITYRLLRPVDEYKIEILLTLALVTGGYALAELVHVSGPICIVAAGIVIGNLGRSAGMSDRTRERLDIFWDLVDEILNAVLFLLIGLEILIIPITWNDVALGAMAIAAVLIGRFLSVGLPIGILRLLHHRFDDGTVRILTWGGLRGGLSIAMALSLPWVPEKAIIIPVTYIVVLFSILVQGLTFERVVAAAMKKD